MPWRWHHCRTIAVAFVTETTSSAAPCQTDTLGQLPRCSEAARTLSAQTVPDSIGALRMAARASRTFPATP